jgi:hypothetical protein
MDKWLPGHSCKRDFIGEMAQKLKAQNIKVILYFHASDAHDMSKEDRLKSGAEEYKPWTKWNNFTNELLQEELERYGKIIDGFFIDGGLPEYVDAPRLRKTIKNYNENLWIIVNAVSRPDLMDFINDENYPQGENFRHVRKCMRFISSDFDYRTRFVGSHYNRLYPEEAYRLIVFHAAIYAREGGGVNWQITPYTDGLEVGAKTFFEKLGEYLGMAGSSLYGAKPSEAWKSYDNQDWLKSHYAAMQSPNGRTTYLHLFDPPYRCILALPPPENGMKFCSIRSFHSGRELAFTQTNDGIKIELPKCEQSSIDTILVLE